MLPVGYIYKSNIHCVTLRMQAFLDYRLHFLHLLFLPYLFGVRVLVCVCLFTVVCWTGLHRCRPLFHTASCVSVSCLSCCHFHRRVMMRDAVYSFPIFISKSLKQIYIIHLLCLIWNTDHKNLLHDFS